MSDKDHTIEKYDFDKFEKENSPFTVVPSHIIKALINKRDQLALWVYLQSLPPDWTINKYHIMKELKISERTYHSYMKLLSDCNLIEYKRNRDSKGYLGPVTIKVMNGSRFMYNVVSNHTANICIVEKIHTATSPQCGQPTIVDDCAHTKETDLQKKNSLKKETTTKQHESSSVSFVFSKSKDNQFLKLKLPIDERTDYLFLDNIKHHIENNSDKKYSLYQREAAVKKLLKKLYDLKTPFQSVGYVDQEALKRQKEKQELERQQRELIAERKRLKELDEYFKENFSDHRGENEPSKSIKEMLKLIRKG